MYRINKGQRFNKPLVLQLNLSSIGDNVCCLPIILNMLENSESEIKISVMKGFGSIFKEFIDEDLIIEDKKPKEFLADGYLLKQAYIPRITNTSVHLVDYFSLTLGNKLLTEFEKILPKYKTKGLDLSKFDVDFSKAVLIDTNYMWETRSILGEEINRVCEFIKNRGYTPVFVGKEYKSPEGIDGFREVKMATDVDKSLGVDLVNKTTIPEIMEIISISKCLLGADGGLMHLGALTETPMVIAFTVADPNDRLHYRDNEFGKDCHVILPDVDCRFCMKNMSMEFNHDFMNCFYDDYQCVKELTSDKFVLKLINIL